MKWKIYKVTNLINEKIYVGITKQKTNARFCGHCCKRPSIGKNRQTVLGSSIQKYGKENFVIEVIDFADSLEEALQKETFYIQKLNSLAKNGGGYNIIENSVSGELTPESRAKMSKTKSEQKKINFKAKQSSTQFVGIYFLQERQRWAWAFNINGKRVLSKNFSTDFDAALDRDINLVEYFTKKICLLIMNFPEKYQDIIDNKIQRPEKEMKRKLKKSNYHFVAYEKGKETWRARIVDKGKSLASISSFSDQNDAAEVADYLNLKYLGREDLLNFPERKEEFLSETYKIPPTNLHKSSALPYENLSMNNKNGRVGYRIHLQYRGIKHRDHFTTLEAAIKRRDELRTQYGLQLAIDFPELL